MTAKFLTPDEVSHLKQRAFSIAEQHVENRYHKLGKGFGAALFRSCLAKWGCGATTVAARLNSEATDHIQNAWQYRDHIAGILLQRSDNGYLPLFLHNASLADKLAMSGSIWVDFRAVERELNRD